MYKAFCESYRDFAQAGREAMVSSFMVPNPVALDTAAKELPNFEISWNV